MAAAVVEPGSYEDEVLAEQLEWSEEHYDPETFVKEYEQSLPHIVRVCEGIYGVSDASSFSTGDVYKVHGIRRENKILASVCTAPGNTNEKITIPKSFQGTLEVIPTGRQAHMVRSDNEYKIDELLTDFTLPVRTKFVNFDRATHQMLQELGGQDSIFTLEKEVTDTYLIASTKVNGKRFMCIMTLSVEVEFQVAEQDDDYELIVNKFELPNIEVGEMCSIPYLEYYERPTVYRPGEAEYLNAEAIIIAKSQVSRPTGQLLPSPKIDGKAPVPPIIDRAKKPMPLEPPNSPTNGGNPPKLPPRPSKPTTYEVHDFDDDDYELIPEDLHHARKTIITQRTQENQQNLTQGSYDNIIKKASGHNKPDVYENFTPLQPLTQASLPQPKKPFPVEHMTVQQVATFLRDEIHVTEEAVGKFIENEVDGQMFKSLLEEGDYSSLVQELNITKLQAKKIRMYVMDGWRPKT